MLVLGAGVDYALLLVARYREELHNVQDRHEAMAHALHRAAPAILASGTTVIVGLLCLVFAQMNSTRGLGPVGAAGIACALLVMMVLLPALLVIVGRWIFWPFIPRFGDPISTERGLWARIGQRITSRPRAVWVATSVILGALSLGILQLDASGLSNEDSFTTDQRSIAAEEAVASHFPGGAGNPVVILADSGHTDAVRRRSGTSRASRRPASRSRTSRAVGSTWRPRSRHHPTPRPRSTPSTACVRPCATSTEPPRWWEARPR